MGMDSVYWRRFEDPLGRVKTAMMPFSDFILVLCKLKAINLVTAV